MNATLSPGSIYRLAGSKTVTTLASLQSALSIRTLCAAHQEIGVFVVRAVAARPANAERDKAKLRCASVNGQILSWVLSDGDVDPVSETKCGMMQDILGLTFPTETSLVLMLSLLNLLKE